MTAREIRCHNHHLIRVGEYLWCLTCNAFRHKDADWKPWKMDMTADEIQKKVCRGRVGYGRVV